MAKKKAEKAEKAPAADKAAKKAARMEMIKNRPAVQRENSKQIDVIANEFGKDGLPVGNHVKVMANSLRKTGALVVAVLYSAKGEIISVSAPAFVPGVKVKAKKNHGNLVPGVAGAGKGKKGEGEEADDEEETDKATEKKAKGKGKKND